MNEEDDPPRNPSLKEVNEKPNVICWKSLKTTKAAAKLPGVGVSQLHYFVRPQNTEYLQFHIT
jgi:hypothetical protein